MKGEIFEELISSYGEPLYRKTIDRSKLSKIEIASGDVFNEVAVFKLDCPSKVMVAARYSEWHCNSGERAVVKELLSENTKLRDMLDKYDCSKCAHDNTHRFEWDRYCKFCCNAVPSNNFKVSEVAKGTVNI